MNKYREIKFLVVNANAVTETPPGGTICYYITHKKLYALAEKLRAIIKEEIENHMEGGGIFHVETDQVIGMLHLLISKNNSKVNTKLVKELGRDPVFS